MKRIFTETNNSPLTDSLIRVTMHLDIYYRDENVLIAKTTGKNNPKYYIYLIVEDVGLKSMELSYLFPYLDEKNIRWMDNLELPCDVFVKGYIPPDNHTSLDIDAELIEQEKDFRQELSLILN